MLFGLDLFRRRLTVTPNFKNFKNIKPTRKIWDSYEKLEQLGEGAYGKVFKVKLK